MTLPTLSSDERRRRVPFLIVLGERERERERERASEREPPSTPAHSARTPHPARAAAAGTPMPTTRTLQAHSLPPRPPLPGRPPAAAAPGRNAGPDAAAHPLRPSRHRAHLNARHPRPPDPGPDRNRSGVKTGLDRSVIIRKAPLHVLVLWCFVFVVTESSTGPIKRFKEMTVAHVGDHG